MKNILFLIDENQVVKNELQHSFNVDFLPTSEIEFTPKEEIAIKLIQFSSKNFIVTSKNAVQATKDMSFDGEFFVVGQKVGFQLFELDRKINFIAMDANGLVEYLENEAFIGSSFTYLCGDPHRPELNQSKLKGRINEVICYKANPVFTKINETYDAYVFCNANAVNIFAKKNEIPSHAKIYALGNTTTKEIENVLHRKVVQANEPSMQALIETIKNNENA